MIIIKTERDIIVAEEFDASTGFFREVGSRNRIVLSAPDGKGGWVNTPTNWSGQTSTPVLWAEVSSRYATACLECHVEVEVVDLAEKVFPHGRAWVCPSGHVVSYAPDYQMRTRAGMHARAQQEDAERDAAGWDYAGVSSPAENEHVPHDDTDEEEAMHNRS